jgi:hypothetical protein
MPFSIITSGSTFQQNLGALLTLAGGLVVLITWVFRYRIVELSKRKGHTPTEVLFGGYEKLLKQYQNNLVDREAKYIALEDSFKHIQGELNDAQNTIRELRQEDARKSRVIKTMGKTIEELRLIATPPEQ